MAATGDNPELSTAFNLTNSFWKRYFEAYGHDHRISTSQLSNIFGVCTEPAFMGIILFLMRCCRS